MVVSDGGIYWWYLFVVSDGIYWWYLLVLSVGGIC